MIPNPTFEVKFLADFMLQHYLKFVSKLIPTYQPKKNLPDLTEINQNPDVFI